MTYSFGSFTVTTRCRLPDHTVWSVLTHLIGEPERWEVTTQPDADVGDILAAVEAAAPPHFAPGTFSTQSPRG